MNESLAVGSVNAEIFTSPHATPALDPQAALLRIIGKAKHSILFAVYAWTLAPLAQAVIAKNQAGVIVRGVADRSEYGLPNSQFPAMFAAGIDLRLWGGKYAFAHEKVLIVDDAVVALGSFNFTNSAEKVNREVLLICHGAQVSRQMAPILRAQIEATYIAGSAPAP